MPVVPIREGAQQRPAPALPPPPASFLMMAAAQMHSEGRLVQSKYGEPDAVKDNTKPPPPELYRPSNGIQTADSMMT